MSKKGRTEGERHKVEHSYSLYIQVYIEKLVKIKGRREKNVTKKGSRNEEERYIEHSHRKKQVSWLWLIHSGWSGGFEPLPGSLWTDYPAQDRHTRLLAPLIFVHRTGIQDY